VTYAILTFPCSQQDDMHKSLLDGAAPEPVSRPIPRGLPTPPAGSSVSSQSGGGPPAPTSPRSAAAQSTVHSSQEPPVKDVGTPLTHLTSP